MRITELLSSDMGIGTSSELNSPSHTHTFQEGEKGGEAAKWIMEGHSEQTTDGFTNCLSPQGYHIYVVSYQHMHLFLELIN